MWVYGYIFLSDHLYIHAVISLTFLPLLFILYKILWYWQKDGLGKMWIPEANLCYLSFQDSASDESKLKSIPPPSVSITLAALTGSSSSDPANGPKVKVEDHTNSTHVDSSSSPSSGFNSDDRLRVTENGMWAVLFISWLRTQYFMPLISLFSV